jgi:diaminopimelate epimerase
VQFVKMQGLGNDFVVVARSVHVTADLVRRLCDRRFGVGADGLLQVGVDAAGLVTMGYWNADGSDAEMCGNGLRCVARHAVDAGLVDATEFEVVTPVGPRRVALGDDKVTVDLGPVEVGDEVTIGGRAYTMASVGNPHLVAIGADPDHVDVVGIGESIQRHPRFPYGTNVEFVEVVAPDRLAVRVWERGVGETLACGSGMVAAAAVAHRAGAGATVEVEVPGGVASVRIEESASWLTGPAETVFEGRWFSGSF